PAHGRRAPLIGTDAPQHDAAEGRLLAHADRNRRRGTQERLPQRLPRWEAERGHEAAEEPCHRESDGEAGEADREPTPELARPGVPPKADARRAAQVEAPPRGEDAGH